MLREERQEVSRCRTLLAWDIDLITNDSSLLSEVEIVCFNCIVWVPFRTGQNNNYFRIPVKKRSQQK